MPSAGFNAAPLPAGATGPAVNTTPVAFMPLLIVILIGVLVALQYRLWVGPGSIADLHGQQQEIAEQKVELERLRTRNQELRAEVEDLRSGEAALEERARGELGMIKPGEAFIQVIERSKPLPPEPKTTPEKKVKPKP